MGHAHVFFRAFFDDRHAASPLVVVAEALTNLAEETLVDFVNDLKMPRQYPAEQADRPALQGFGQPYPHVVFTGGDPLRRPDLETLVAAATARGIGASLAPAATFLFGFTLTWNDYDRTVLNVIGDPTLPLEIVGLIQNSALRPDLYALGTATTLVTLPEVSDKTTW